MGNFKFQVASSICLPFLLAGCQTTFGLLDSPGNISDSTPETHFLIFAHPDSTYVTIKAIDDPNENIVLQYQQNFAVLYQFPASIGCADALYHSLFEI